MKNMFNIDKSIRQKQLQTEIKNKMSYLVYLTQKISPFECCRQPINTNKELNLHQSQLLEPLKLSSYDKSQKIKKVVHVHDFYQSSGVQNNFKVVEKSYFQEFLKECEKNHEMFSDKQFQVGENMINGMGQDKKIVWRRLSQIYNRSNYSVISTRKNSQQSLSQRMQFTPLKSSPYMSVLSMIKQKPNLINQIFSTSQQPLNNFGIYRLILNDHGYPKQVVIDDYVPVYINTNQLLLVHPYMNQLWPVILEKSIAKIVGSYSKLQSMNACQILRLITPAPTVKYELHTNQASQNFLHHLQKIKNAILNQQLICTASRSDLQNKKIKSSHTYTIIEVENNPNQQPLIVMLDPLYQDDGLTQNQSGMSHNSNISKPNSYKQIFKLKYTSFAKYFDYFSICYFHDNFNMDFQRMQIANRKPHFINLKIQQSSEIILTFSKVKRRFMQLPFFNLSQITNGIKQITGIKGGWLKVLIARQSHNHKQSFLQFVQSRIETEDNILSLHFDYLKDGQYLIYLEGYSQENETEFYSFTGYCSKPIFMSSQKQRSTRMQYFLEGVMLNHCLSSESDKKVEKNYFIENDSQSWYISNLLYKQGGFGYLVIYVSKDCKFSAEITIDSDKIRQEGYKLECKKATKLYKKVIEPGSADVIVFSINYEAKKETHKVQFPPKSVQIQIFQKALK